MYVKPWFVTVLRVRVHTHPHAVMPYNWEVLGTLLDLSWDFSTCTPTPMKFGAESETSFLVSADDLGLDQRTCADYMHAAIAHKEQLEHYRTFGCPPCRYAALDERIAEYEAIMAAKGPVIEQAVRDCFPAWRAALEAPAPPWVGATTVVPTPAAAVTVSAMSQPPWTTAEDGADLYV